MKHEVAQSLVEIQVDATAGTAVAEFRFDPELSVFGGHFPNLAIVPGVFLIEASRLLAEKVAATKLRIDEVQTARFTSELHPGDRVTGTVTVMESEGSWTCDAIFAADTVQAARVRLTLGSA